MDFIYKDELKNLTKKSLFDNVQLPSQRDFRSTILIFFCIIFRLPIESIAISIKGYDYNARYV
jgi:hypothetical protein